MKITAAEFKAKCLALMDQVAKTHEPIVITKRGKPIAQLLPVEVESQRLFGCMAGTVIFEGDILAPLGVEWAAESGEDDDFFALAPKTSKRKLPKAAK